MAKTGSFRSFDGERLEYFYCKGTKAPIVFLPALGFDWTYWKKSLDYFRERGHGVLALTLRGHSQARARMRGISMDDHLRDLKSLFSGLKIQDPVLVGVSLGGAVAASYKAESRKSVCICINTPFNIRQLRFYIRFLAWLCRPLVWLDWFRRPGNLNLDFSRSKVTNNVIMMLEGVLKFNSYGIYLNYRCLEMSSLKHEGCTTVLSNKDEVLKSSAKAEYVVDGNHNCAISKSHQINALLQRIISLKTR